MAKPRSWNCDEDVGEKLDKYLSSTRSRTINKALREFFRLPEMEVEPMVNIRTKNIDAILTIINERQFVHFNTLEKLASVDLGVAPKKCREYVEALEGVGHIIFLNGWAVSKSYDGPLPWSEKFAELVRAKGKEKTAKKEQRIASVPEEGIPALDEFIASRPVDIDAPSGHTHTDKTEPCGLCGKMVCIGCAGTWIGGTPPTARCRICA
jgi:hypothetical protein